MEGGELFTRIQDRAESAFTERGKHFHPELQKYSRMSEKNFGIS